MVRNRRNADRVFAALVDFTRSASIALAINVQGRLAEDTPKDTSWASINWIIELNAPFRDLAGTREDPDPSLQLRGLAGVRNWTLTTPAYISNNVPYIQPLNAGSSRQAPRMFVERAIQSEIIRTTREARP